MVHPIQKSGKHLNEIESVEEIARSLGGLARTETLCSIDLNGRTLPVRALIFEKDRDATRPVLALFGGVHGLERIGSEVVIAHLRSFSEFLRWDATMQQWLEQVRLIFVPIVNPSGIVLGTRANANGVDLMRNAPIDSPEPEPSWKIHRGHRLSPLLPWYRGKSGTPPELETQAVMEFVEREILPSRASICVDVHSGFGAVDRLWYPYATRTEAFPNLPEALKLKGLLDRTLPNHVYVVEPQSDQYTTHGDIWDHLYELRRQRNLPGVFLPLTLEMGSWNWLKKNPLHAFRNQALFHPIKLHRIRRVLRRHSALFDFLLRATLNWERWAATEAEKNS